jgi:SAM-dependent methyltransferase
VGSGKGVGNTAREATYAYDNARSGQSARLRTLEALLDPGTVRHLEARGVGPGWRCLEVGAGGGSIAAWLCDRVGPDGSVLATDLDTTVLERLSEPNLEIRAHDVLADDLPEAEFDLVHMRLLLAWLRDPAPALRRLVAALRPGGWLVAEEMDFVSAVPEPRLGERRAAVFERVVAAHNAVLARRHTFDPLYGRRVAGDLAHAGLAAVDAEGRVAMWRGGGDGGRIWRLTVQQLRDEMVETGIVTGEDVDVALELFDDPDAAVVSQITMAAWGRRPD